jgi:UDP-N-acetylglucosamine--N-acetylmuramyl-(pentapeptide) pyrophosphoryl-undecaprenol N-acetylglucosamine transferase
VALATGGTAGHVTPALAVAAAYRALRPDADVCFLGSVAGFEQRLLVGERQQCETLPAAPWYGVSRRGRLRAVQQLLNGIVQARRVLTAQRIELVVGFGGYASAGAVLAARSLGIATALHEANAVPGLANRLLGRVADRIFLGFADAGAHFAAPRSRHTGTPIRAELSALGEHRHGAPGADRAHLLVCGGSLGSTFLNRHGPELAAALRERGVALAVRHQGGNEPLEPIRAAYGAAGVGADVEDYFDDVGAAYRWADIVVTCAGAATLAELAVAGVPALLVPLARASDDHQADNAAAWAAQTGAPWVRETGWCTEAVAVQLSALLRDADAWRVLAARTRAVALPEAAATVVRECELLLTTR